MKHAVCHIVAAVLLGLLLFSCSGRPRIIPRATLTDIYADMFLADQWLRDNSSERQRADTSLFYDPIFARYGYTFEDYDATVRKYMEDPEKFSKIFRDAAEKLRKGRDKYDKKLQDLKRIKEFNEAFKNYSSTDFDSDTLLWSPPAADTLVLDSLTLDSLRRDSLRLDSLRVDSLRLDSIARSKDLVMRDSLRRDSLSRLYKRRDSLFRKRQRVNTTNL